MADPVRTDPRSVPIPPRLHWGIVLALQIVTFGLFSLAWLPVQAWWAKKMTGDGKPFVWSLINLGLLPVFMVTLIVMGAALGATGHAADAAPTSAGVTELFRILFIAGNLITVFVLRTRLESYPISIPLSAVMTFFFGTIYFQYHLRDYTLPDAEEVYGSLAAAPAYVPPPTAL